MTEFYGWYTLLTPHHADTLISSLVRRGMSVRGLNAERTVQEGRFSCLCALHIQCEVPQQTTSGAAGWVSRVIKTILDEANIPHYSLITVHMAGGSANWYGDYFPAQPAPTPPVSYTHLTLPTKA